LHAYLRDPNGSKYKPDRASGPSPAWARGDFGDFVLGDFTLVPSAGASLQQGGANLVTGSYVPYFNSGAGRWTNGIQDVGLDGIHGPAGAWTLVIEDWANMDTGGLSGWSLVGFDIDPQPRLLRR
jgi:hypothetical protein